MSLKSSIIGLLNSRETTRNAIEWWVHRQTQVYVLSYPKCGRTWLRLMIGKALDEHYGLGVANPMELGRMHRLHRAIPRIRVTHEHAHKAETIEAGKERFADKTVIFLVRDPRDVLVSMYFEASRRSDLFRGDIGAFLRGKVGGIDAVIDYYNVWAEARKVPQRFELVRYEEMHRAPSETLQRVLAAMAVPVGSEAIDKAIQFSKFDNMRKLEKTDAFGSARLRAGRAGDAESFKTRKGKIGGYHEYLIGADLDYANERIAERLAPYYAAYRSGDDRLHA